MAFSHTVDTDFDRYDLSGLGATLAARAQGQGGPSEAELQLQAGLGSAQGRAQGFAASNRAVNPALAQRQGLAAGTQLSMDANQQATLLRAQEQREALAMQMALEQFRSNQAQAYAGFDLQGQMFNARQNSGADAQYLKLVGAGLGAAGSAGGMAF